MRPRRRTNEDHAARLYGVLLRTYPRRFREQYGDELTRVFAQTRREPRFVGPFGALRFWRFVLADFAISRARLSTLGPVPIPTGLTRPSRSRSAMLRDDLRDAFRSLVRRPALSTMAVLLLGLGLGANALIFALVDGLVLKPFPFRDPDWLVALGVTYPRLDGEERFIEAISPAEYLDIRAISGLHQVMAFDLGNRNLSDGGRAERVFTGIIWGNPFETLGMPPLHGRGFLPEEMRPGGRPAAILSHRVFVNQFSADPAIVGRAIRVNGQTTTVVGIMPPGLLLLGTDLWLPLAADPLDWPRERRQFTVLGRLRPGVSRDAANVELQALAARTARDHGAEFKEYAGWRLQATPFHHALLRQQRPLGFLLLGVAGLVLVILCANLTNALLAHAAARTREVAVRVALGASRWAIARRMLFESLAIAALGGALGLVVAYGGLTLLRPLLPATLTSMGLDVGLTIRAVLYGLLVASAAGVATGLVPALQASLVSPDATLRAQSVTVTPSRRAQRVRQAIIVVEVALAAVLLVGGGLLTRSVLALQAVDTGFDRRQVLTMRITLPPQKYDRAGVDAFFESLVDRVRAIPGVARAATATQVPPDVSFATQIRLDGAPAAREGELPTSLYTLASQDYFAALRIPLAAGRVFDARDTARAPHVAVVNESFARRYFPASPPIGRRVAMAGENADASNIRWAEIVGVVRDTRSRGAATPPSPELYFDVRQLEGAWNQLFLLVRTSADPRALLPEVRRAVASLDPDQPVYAVRTLDEAFAQADLQRRVTTWLVAAFGVLAVTLAAVGIYGVLACAVAARTREIAVRVALGADRGRVAGRVTAEALGLVGVGLGIGLGIALAIGPLVAGLLYQVPATDPTTFVLVAVTLALVGFAASALPARRATAIDPALALRIE
jgi:putative ABC transport system permease protein